MLCFQTQESWGGEWLPYHYPLCSGQHQLQKVQGPRCVSMRLKSDWQCDCTDTVPCSVMAGSASFTMTNNCDLRAQGLPYFLPPNFEFLMIEKLNVEWQAQQELLEHWTRVLGLINILFIKDVKEFDLRHGEAVLVFKIKSFESLWEYELTTKLNVI